MDLVELVMSMLVCSDNLFEADFVLSVQSSQETWANNAVWEPTMKEDASVLDGELLLLLKISW
jgi:hypothetical protein